ncbi:MAG: recombination protein RecR, partial [Gammaproteobacteria bacterium]|nr:recombination protein RecR [Gammaproteobacteria bacterium]
MRFTPALENLINALRALPGVGKKSAQRMAFQLLERDRDGAQRISQSLEEALERIGHCTQCRMFAEEELCPICASPKRDASTLCIVETPADVIAIEQTGCFSGQYFVLMGHLSPIDGIGPSDLGIPVLQARLQQAQVKEMILATNPTVEGEATAHFLAELAKQYEITPSRIAHGVPI